jgi:hypothetical protein
MIFLTASVAASAVKGPVFNSVCGGVQYVACDQLFQSVSVTVNAANGQIF